VDAVREALIGATQADALTGDRAAGALPFSDDILEALRLYASGNSPVDIALAMNRPFESVKGFIATVREHYAAEGRAVASKQELIRRAAEDGYLL
jgi:hypothetical protein